MQYQFGIILWLWVTCGAMAQNTTVRQQIWLGGWAQVRFTEKWGLWLDGQYRTFDKLYEKTSTVAGRMGFIYKLNSSLRLVAGYAYFRITPQTGKSPVPHEHRGWQMIQHTWKNAKIRLIQNIRTEQRFRERIEQGAHTNSYAFNHRFRYNANLTIKLTEKKGLVIGNEAMLNTGKEIVYNQFDQNRAWIGLEQNLSPKVRVQLLYMFLYQHLPRPQERLLSHNIRLSFFKN